MESRKVQHVGYSTLSVSLPRNWVKDIGLKPGDLVVFSPEKDGSLKLMPSALAERKEEVEEFIINSDLCDEEGMLERIIVGNYILGRDIIRIISSKRIQSMHIEEVRDILRRLIGLGIVEETPSQIVLQCSIDPTKFQIDMLLRRLSVIASTMLTETTQALVELNPELAKDAIRREDEADTVYWLALRLLFSAQRIRTTAEKIGFEEPLQILHYGLTLVYLELIADYTEKIARRALLFEEHKNKINQHAMEMISNISELAHAIFQKAMDCFFSRDITIANSILQARKVIKTKEEKLLRELPEIPPLRAIVLCLSRIADRGAGIAVIAINRALEKPTKICSAY